MIITLTIDADDFKLYQVLEKFSTKYQTNYSLSRESDAFKLRIRTDNFGELTRRLNHIKDCSFHIQEIVKSDNVNNASLNLTNTNIDALIGKETVAQSNISPVDGGQIKLIGEIWFSRPLYDRVIRKGSLVRVVRIEGVSLIVDEVDESNS